MDIGIDGERINMVFGSQSAPKTVLGYKVDGSPKMNAELAPIEFAPIKFGSFNDMVNPFYEKLKDMAEYVDIRYPLTDRQEKRSRRSKRRNKKRSNGTRRSKRLKYNPLRSGVRGYAHLGGLKISKKDGGYYDNSFSVKFVSGGFYHHQDLTHIDKHARS